MRIGVNTLFFIPGQVGGTETFLRQTLVALARDFPGLSLTLFTNRENDAVLRQDLVGCDNVRFENLGFRASNRAVRILREQLQLPLRARQAAIDVLWSPGYTAPWSCGGIPQVVTIHDMQYKSHPEDLTVCERLATDFLVRMAARRCDRIVAVSHFAKQEICDYTTAPEEKVSVVHEAASSLFSGEAPSAETRLAAMGITAQRPFMLAVSNTYPHKRMHLALETLACLEPRRDLSLVMVGGARRGEAEVLHAMKKVRDKERVVRLQGLDFQDLVALYQQAAVFLFPSAYEGFGLPVLEALMAGVPVVAARRASIPEVGGEHVTYVANEEDPSCWAAAVRDVLAWPPERKKEWRAAARLHASTFSWSKTAQGIVACCEGLLSSG